MSQPAASGGYVPQPGGRYDPIYTQQQQQQQQQQLYAYNNNNAGVAHPAPVAHTASAASSRSTLRNIVGVSTFLNAVGGLCVVIGALLPIRRYTYGPFVLEYYLYTGRLDGESYPIGDTLQTPYAIAMSLAMICGFLALFIALPIGIYDIRALSHQVEQPHQRRGCVRFMRTIVLLIAIKMGAVASFMSMFTTTVDSYGDDEVVTLSTSNLCEGFALLVIGTGLLALSDMLCLCHVIMAARVPQNGGDQQHLIHNQQQYHPQHQYPQHQQHYQAAPTVYQGVPIGGGGGDHSTSTTSTPINAAPHPGYHHPNASYT